MTTIKVDPAPVPTAGNAADTRAGRRDWLALAVIALPCMVYAMDLTVLNLAVPDMARDLKPTAGQLLWIIDIYGFMVAGCLMIMGTLGDRLGRRRILLIGAATFGMVSALAAFARTAEQMIVARALLGIAGATLAPSTLSLITSIFRNEGQRIFAISIWVMSFSVGAIIGPVVSGLILQYSWWGAVFLAGVPVMLLLLVLGPFLLPEFRDGKSGRIDLVSAGLSLAGVLILIYGVKRWAESGLDGRAVFCMGAGIALAIVFILRQRRLDDPLIDLSLFRSRVFSLSVGINLFAMFFLFGSFIYFAQYLQLVVGLSPLQAGFWLLPGALAFTLASPLTAALAVRFGTTNLMAAGLALSAAGFSLLGLSSTLIEVVSANVLIALGCTPVFSLTTGFIVGAAPVEKAGIASAISETATEFGGAFGIAILGSALTAIYSAGVAAFDFSQLPPEAADRARSTLAGAVEASQQMGGAAGDALRDLGRGAFTEAYQFIAWLAALSLACLAILTHRILSGGRPA